MALTLSDAEIATAATVAAEGSKMHPYGLLCLPRDGLSGGRAGEEN